MNYDILFVNSITEWVCRYFFIVMSFNKVFVYLNDYNQKDTLLYMMIDKFNSILYNHFLF